MRFLATTCAVLVTFGWTWGCSANQEPVQPETHKVKIKVDKVKKKTKIKKVVASREDTIEFTAEAGPVTIIIPTGDSVIKPDDRVIIFAIRQAIPKIEKMLSVKLEYF